MDALSLVSLLKNTGEKAEKNMALEKEQYFCQEGTDCDCRGCNDSG